MDDERRALVEQVVLGSVVAGVASVDPAAAMLAGGAAPALERAFDRWRADQARRRDHALHIACEHAETDLEELVHRLTASDELVLTLVEAVRAAQATAVEAKVEALGRSLGQLATDEAVVDAELLWVRILADLEAPHIRVLLRLNADDPERPGHLGFFRSFDLEEITGSAALATVILSTLEQHALSRRIDAEAVRQARMSPRARALASRESPPPKSTASEPVWWLRGPLGGECLRRLGMASEDDEG